MPRDVKAILTELVLSKGFVAGDEPYCSVEDMTRCMPDFDTMRESEPLSDLHKRALMENFRRVVTRTAHGRTAVVSLHKQSTLRRWRFLRRASPEAADAYIEVLRYFDISPPEYLFGDPRS